MPVHTLCLLFAQRAGVSLADDEMSPHTTMGGLTLGQAVRLGCTPQEPQELAMGSRVPAMGSQGAADGVIPSARLADELSELRRRTRDLEKHVQHLQRGSEACCTALAAAVAEIRALTRHVGVQTVASHGAEGSSFPDNDQADARNVDLMRFYAEEPGGADTFAEWISIMRREAVAGAQHEQAGGTEPPETAGGTEQPEQAEGKEPPEQSTDAGCGGEHQSAPAVSPRRGRPSHSADDTTGTGAVPTTSGRLACQSSWPPMHLRKRPLPSPLTPPAPPRRRLSPHPRASSESPPPERAATDRRKAATLRIGDLEPLADEHLQRMMKDFLSPWQRWHGPIRAFRGRGVRGDALAYVDFYDIVAAREAFAAASKHRVRWMDGTYRNWHCKWAD